MSPRHVFLSPHPDDAVWSCGGLLLALVGSGAQVLVITVFDGKSPCLRDEWRRVASSPLRPQEDARALARIGAAGISLGLTDAALRQVEGAYLYPDIASILSANAAADPPLCRTIGRRLEALLHDDDHLYVPFAGRGSHVDHRIVRIAAGYVPNLQRNYQDFPYAEHGPDFPVDPALLPDWIEAACLYGSQAIGLFGTRERFRTTLRAWATRGLAEFTGMA